MWSTREVEGHRARLAELWGVNDFERFLAEVLEPRILPAYRRPYPDGGPRIVHGDIHVSRCVIFAQAMMTHYVRDAGVPASRFDPLAIRLALGWHDAGREGEGRDRWESDSAALARAFVRELGLSDGYGDYVGSLIIHEQRRARDPNSHIVQACDTLDILRVYPGRSFRTELFHFLHPRTDPLRCGTTAHERQSDDGAAVRKAVLAEAAAFIEHTEDIWVRRTLEASPRCARDLLALAQDATEYPTLHDLLRT